VWVPRAVGVLPRAQDRRGHQCPGRCLLNNGEWSPLDTQVPEAQGSEPASMCGNVAGPVFHA
jgi:hypothetical protein